MPLPNSIKRLVNFKRSRSEDKVNRRYPKSPRFPSLRNAQHNEGPTMFLSQSILMDYPSSRTPSPISGGEQFSVLKWNTMNFWMTNPDEPECASRAMTGIENGCCIDLSMNRTFSQFSSFSFIFTPPTQR